MEDNMQSESINELAKALAAAQSEIQDPTKTKTGKVSGTTKAGKWYEYEYKYADLADVLRNVRAALTKQEIAVSQPTVVHDNIMLVQTMLMHSSGQWIKSDYPVCSINGEHQKMGAALTYAKRYALTSMVGVAADDDTDGAGAAQADAPAKRKSSAQRGRDGEWDKLEADLLDCQSASDVEKLHETYRAKEYREWSEAWRWKADERFAQRLAEFSQGDALRETLAESVAADSNSIETKADYVQWAHEQIENAPTSTALREWWAAEAPARTRFRFSMPETNDLKDRCAARTREMAPIISMG